MSDELDNALSEAERLRGALRSFLAAAQRYAKECGGSDHHRDDCSKDGNCVYCRFDTEATNAQAALSPATPAAPSHDPTMPPGVVPGPTGAASSCRAPNRGVAVPGVPASLADDTMSPYRRGYERAVEDAVLAVVNCGEANAPGGFRSLVERGEAEDAIRSLLPAPEGEWTEAEVERIARACANFEHGAGWWEEAAGSGGHEWWKRMARAVLATFRPREVTEAEVERMVALLMRLCPSQAATMDDWREKARAVLAAQGEGRGK